MDIPDRERSKHDLVLETLRSSGALRLQAMGSSMLPSLWPGDVVKIEACAEDAIRVGDIVLFAREQRFFIHRVREKVFGPHGQTLMTRGDSLPTNDPPVGGEELLGRVAQIYRRGAALAPQPLTGIAAILARILACSDFSRRIVLRWHGRRSTDRLTHELASSI